MKLARKEIFTLIISIFIILSVLYVVYFYQPIMNETNILEDQLSQLNEDIIKSKNSNVEIEKLKNELDSLRSILGPFHEAFFKATEQAEVLLFLEELIEPFGIKKTIRFEEVEDFGTYKIARVIVNLETNYPNLQQILKGIEQSPWGNRVEMLNAIIQNRENLISQLYDMEVEMTVGFYCQ